MTTSNDAFPCQIIEVGPLLYIVVCPNPKDVAKQLAQSSFEKDWDRFIDCDDNPWFAVSLNIHEYGGRKRDSVAVFEQLQKIWDLLYRQRVVEFGKLPPITSFQPNQLVAG